MKKNLFAKKTIVVSFLLMCLLITPISARSQAVTPPNENLAFVSNHYSHTLSVFDISTNTFLKLINVGNNPLRPVINPIGTHVYVPNAGSNSISIINIQTLAVERTVPFDVGPGELVFSPDGNYMYLANGTGDGVITKFDLNDSTFQTWIWYHVTSTPTGIDISADGKFLYVTNAYSAKVSVINTETGETNHVNVGTRPTRIKISPDQTKAFVTNSGSGSVSVLDLPLEFPVNEAEKIHTFYVGNDPLGVTFNSDGSFAYVALFGGGTGKYVKVINTLTYAISSSIDTTGQAPQDPMRSPDGRYIYVMNAKSNDISVIDIITNQVVQKFSSRGINPSFIAFAGYYPLNDPPVVNIGDPYIGQEGIGIPLDKAIVADPNNDTLIYSWTIDSPNCSFSDPYILHPILLCKNDGNFRASLTVSDDVNDAVTSTGNIIVSNLPPDNCSIEAPLYPVLTNTEISSTVSFTDPGVLDEHSVLWDWGDTTTIFGNVVENSGSGYSTNSHTYTIPGVYTILATVADNNGGSCSSMFQYVVSYDPTGGYVTGGGVFDSLPGAYKVDHNINGRANFGFVSKYEKNQSIPTGNTQFKFRAGSLDFNSTTYDWLVVNQQSLNAQFKGSGLINGNSAPNNQEYIFMVWATDQQIDTFRIKIWWEDILGNENIVYDNGFNQPIQGGNIVVHKEK
jgi:YVTN family beta-propeller protein